MRGGPPEMTAGLGTGKEKKASIWKSQYESGDVLHSAGSTLCILPSVLLPAEGGTGPSQHQGSCALHLAVEHGSVSANVWGRTHWTFLRAPEGREPDFYFSANITTRHWFYLQGRQWSCEERPGIDVWSTWQLAELINISFSIPAVYQIHKRTHTQRHTEREGEQSPYLDSEDESDIWAAYLKNKLSKTWQELSGASLLCCWRGKLKVKGEVIHIAKISRLTASLDGVLLQEEES